MEYFLKQKYQQRQYLEIIIYHRTYEEIREIIQQRKNSKIAVENCVTNDSIKSEYERLLQTIYIRLDKKEVMKNRTDEIFAKKIS